MALFLEIDTAVQQQSARNEIETISLFCLVFLFHRIVHVFIGNDSMFSITDGR